MKSRCNVALSGVFVIFLLFLSDVGADALKDESGEDDLKTPLPLVVSIPSKVFRANRLNANDVIGVMPTLDTEKVEFTHFVTSRRPISTTSEESTIASTTTTTTTPSPTTELTTPSTTTTELTTTTTEKETIVANVTKEIEVNHTDSDSIDSRNEPIQLESNATSADNHTSNFEVTTTTTTELTTPSTTTTTTTASTTTTSTTTARSSANEEVAEKDYGQSLGFDLEPELDEHPTFSSDSQDGDGMSVVAAVTNESEIEETTSDEIDPFDVAAQASEVDYAVIASEDQRGFTQTKQEMKRNESVLYENEEEESLEEREEAEESSNATLSNNVNFAEKHNNETDEFENEDENNNNNKQTFASTNALYNLNKKFLSKDDPQKDLLPAASSRGSPTVVGPEAQMDDLSGHTYDDIIPTAEASSAIKQEAAPTAAADPEYEYIYEYVDLNTTDIPTDLPEGVVILTGDQRLPLASTAKPIEVSTESRLTTIDDHHPILEAKSNATIAEEQPLPHDYEEFHPLDGDSKTSDDLKAYTGDDLKSFTSDDMKSFTSDDLKSFTNGDFVTEPATVAADPFVPNFPQSPVYFVGLQRETLPPTDESSAPDSFVSAHSTTTERPKSLRGEAPSDPNVQINNLYALSRALPINDNVPFLIEDGELENTTILLPPDLPDPFSEELLGTSVGIPQSTTEEFFATATTELPSTSTEPATTPTTTTEEPTTTTTEATTTTTTEEPTTSAARATRPGSRRRTTSTSVAPEGSSVEQATTAASGTRQRGQRVGGRRRPTTSTAAPSSSANGGSTNFTLTEKTRTGQRNRRPVLSRTRTTTAGSTIEEAANDSTGDKNGATNDNSISGTNGVKRAGSSRRTLSRPSSNGNGGGANGSENSEAGSTIPQRPTRARRPAISRTGSKLNKEPSKAASSSSNETSSEKKGGDEAATRKPLFRPRNRNRFNLRAKAEAASSTTTTTTTEHHSPSEEAALTTAEHVEGGAGGEHTGEEASDAPAESAGNGNAEKAIATEAPAPSGEHSRKFPPRTRPGARATIRHPQS